MILDIERFAAQERPHWDALERLVRLGEEGTEPEPGVEHAMRLHRLYERAAADLARVRSYSADAELQGYLEDLVARAHAVCQPRGEARFSIVLLVRWFTTGFPRALRRNLAAFYAALALTCVGSLVGGGLLLVEEETKATVLPFSHLLGDPSERVKEEEEKGGELSASDMTVFSTMLMTNNIRVSVLALASGVTFGVGTVLLLFYNGLILGVVGIDYLMAGEGVFLFAWLLPHGSVEIPAIVIAGQAGLMTGGAMLGIGKGSSVAARFRDIRGDLVHLIGGVAVLLVWAGIVEAFLSQTHEPAIPYWLKILFGSLQLAALALFLARAGRGGEGRAA